MSDQRFKLRSTRDYRLFCLSKKNRQIDPLHCGKLRPSMQKYGWLPSAPMAVVRTGGGLEILDGQHRFRIAQELGVAVWFVELEERVDIPTINAGQLPWKLAHYIGNWAARGTADYERLIAFQANHGLPITICAALLAGTTSASNIDTALKDGTYKIKDIEFAEAVASLYGELVRLCPRFGKQVAILAVMACIRTPGFDRRRLAANARRCPEKLREAGTRDGVLVILEEIYNYGRRDLAPLRMNALTHMKERQEKFGRVGQ